MKVDALLKHWNSTAAGCDNNLVCIEKCSYSLKLYDSLWLRSCYDSSVSAISKSGDKVSFFFLCFSFFLSENTSDNFLRICKSVVIWINNSLGKNGSNRFVNSAADKFRADRILKVISNVALAHCGAD